MAISLDAIGTTIQIGTTATSASGTPITVGGNATLLLVAIAFNNEALGAADPTSPTGVSVTWGGASMTQLGTIVGGTWSNVTHGTTEFLFAIVNPASGAQTLAASWTNAASGYVSSISFKGTISSSVAAACPSANVQTNSGTFGGGANAWNWTVTCSVGDWAVACGCDNRGDTSAVSAGTNTAVWDSYTSGQGALVGGNSSRPFAFYSTAPASGSSITLTETVTCIAEGWVGIATDIVAAPTVAPSAFLIGGGHDAIVRDVKSIPW